MELVAIRPSTNKNKKMMATFEVNGRQRTTHFGSRGMMDYTKYYKQDKELANKKKVSYLARHKENEDWNDPTSAGALSRWILWNLPTIEASIQDYKKRFKYL